MNSTKLIIRDLRVDMVIGVYEFEQAGTQPVIVNIEARVENDPDWRADKIENVVSYEDIVLEVRAIAKRAPLALVETFAELIAEFCLRDQRIRNISVRIEKPEIFEDAAAVGVEIFRIQT